MDNKEGVASAQAILVNLKKDIEGDLLSSITDMTRAETFDNFLDHGKLYLQEGKVKEAGVIAGVVFEDTLRRLCAKHGFSEQGLKLDDLISVLQRNSIITPTKAKRARAAAGVRTKATHAQWEEFDSNDVESTVGTTEDLIHNCLDP